MTVFGNRLKRLEQASPAELPANARRWLGMRLMPADEAEADRLDAIPRNEADLTGASPEARAWLTQTD